MRNVVWLFIVVGTWCVPSTVRAADSTPAQERTVLDRALRTGWSTLIRGSAVRPHFRVASDSVAGRRSLDCERRTRQGRPHLHIHPQPYVSLRERAALGSRPLSVEDRVGHRSRSVASAKRSGRGRCLPGAAHLSPDEGGFSLSPGERGSSRGHSRGSPRSRPRDRR